MLKASRFCAPGTRKDHRSPRTSSLSLSLRPRPYREAVGNTVSRPASQPANGGDRGPSPLGDATAGEPTRCRARRGVAWRGGAGGGRRWCQPGVNERPAPEVPKPGDQGPLAVLVGVPQHRRGGAVPKHMTVTTPSG